ncbi:MAG: penicillin-binding protein [Acidobacteriota bacterium]|nr:penicillin-binding protein [Acidobacteriota bacterium]
MNRRAPRVVVFALVAACVLVVSSLVYSYNVAALSIDERLAAGYLTSRAGIFAAPRTLCVGQRLTRERLIDALQRAGYAGTNATGANNVASNVWNGAFVARDDEIEIRPRDATRTDRSADALGFAPAAIRVRFDVQRDAISEITGDDVSLDSFTLEPELLTNDTAEKNASRAALSFADIPPVLTEAIIAIEDRRFFEHRGLDAVGILRAAVSWSGLASDSSAPEHQGGSTITQQLVKNTYLSPERTLRRKFKEAMLAFALERRLSKRDIFALYCNEIYLGQRGGAAVRGVRQAARAYFGKDLRDLSLDEAATIAAMIRSPARYAPDRHADDARARRNVVISAMLREGYVARDEAELAQSSPVNVAPSSFADGATAPYFVDYVNRIIDARLGERTDTDERTLRIHTTIDLELQRLAESAVSRQLARLDERLARSRSARGLDADHKPVATSHKLQAALVALDPRDGRVLALVGGRDYAASQLNRVTDARRQPGSVFKPFVYAAAIERGISPTETFADAPHDFKFDPHAPAYRPTNYGGQFSMRDVTMRTALVKSLNVVTVDLALRTGLDRVSRLAETFGLPRPAPYPSMALGASEATPLEIAAAYTAFARQGARVSPVAVMRASDANGVALIETAAASPRQIVAPSTAYMITDTLTAVLDHGTARGARTLLKVSAAAGKTGTSRDGWFAGYTPNLVCVVWIGYDDNTPINLTGADSALPVWSDFMRGALELRPELGGKAFDVPAGITLVEIDTDTGLRASPSCPQRELVALTPTLIPTTECNAHGNDLSTLFASLTSVSSNSDERIARRAADSARDLLTSDESSHAKLAPALHVAARTQTETSRDGRTALTNDLQLVRDQDRRR